MAEVLPLVRRDDPDPVGRTAERAALASFLASAADAGAVLLLTGDAGVGTTALLEWAAREAEASGTTVLRADGAAFEADVAFAGLHQLLTPLLDDLTDGAAGLPAAHREALSGALGLAAGGPPDRLLVSAAVLGLLRRSAAARPLLLVADDASELDRPTVEVLSFVGRRLHGSRIGLLLAARTGSDVARLHGGGLPALAVPPLDPAAATRLLDARRPGLEPAARRRVLGAAAGNPLALLELPAVPGADPVRPPALGPGVALRRAFAPPVAGLPPATRDVLLLAALEGTGDLRTLRAAAGDRWLDDLAPAEAARVVDIDLRTERLTFRHPLFASAALETAPSGERRRAHEALAGAVVDRPEEAAWHLTQAVTGADPRAAEILEVAALRAQHDGDPARAVTTLLRSADVTPPGPDRARRLAAAAYLRVVTTGELRQVPALLRAARTADPAAAPSGEVAVGATQLLATGDAALGSVHPVLVRAVERALDEGDGAASAADLTYSLLVAAHFGGRADLWPPVEQALAALGPDVPEVLSVSAEVLADPARATAEGLARLDGLVASAQASVDPAHVVRVGIATAYVDGLSGVREALRRVARSGREGGAAASALNALLLLGRDAFDEGRWHEAARTAADGTAWAEELGYGLVARAGHYCRALVAAAQGDEATALALADDLAAWARPRGAGLLEHFAHRVRGLAALGRGDATAAYREFAAISPPGRFAPHAPVAVSVALDLVEAAVRTGRRAEAAAHLGAMRDSHLFTARRRYALLAAGSAALVAGGDEASELFERALALPGAERHPFEHARIRLAHGEHLRRSRAPRASRLQLEAALEAFRDLGAVPWATRAANELRATGRAPRTAPAARQAGPLTAQERQIALLAASGLSNKEIGNRLYLSPRTVGAHLYRVFPKLGIGSRAALRDALDALDGGPAAGPAARPAAAAGVARAHDG